MELLQDILRQSKEDRKIIAVYLNGEDIDFWCGYIQDYTDEYIVLVHFSKFGHYDGILIEQLDRIEQIAFDTDYCEAMSFLVKNNHLLYQQEETAFSIIPGTNWQHELLEQQMGNPNRIVKIQTEGNTLHTGSVKWLDEDNVILELLDADGRPDGTSVFKINTVTMIRVNDLDSRRRLLLCKWRNEKRR